MSAKASRRLRNALIVALVLAALYAAYRYTLHRMVETKLDEIRKQGYPVTLAELDKWYPQPPPGENAADVYLQAFKLLTKQYSDTNLPIVGDAKLPQSGEPMNETMKQSVSNYLSKNEPALALLYQGAKLSSCRYPIDLTQGFATLLPHLIYIRQGARLLSLDATLHAEHGEADQTARSILCVLALANSLRAEPSEISQLVRLTCYRYAVNDLQWALSRVDLSDSTLREFESIFSSAKVVVGQVRGSVGARCMEIDFCAHPAESIAAILTAEDHALPPESNRKVLWLRTTGRLDIFLLRYLHSMSKFLLVCKMPLSEGVKQTEDADPPVSLIHYFMAGTWSLGSDGKTAVQQMAQKSVAMDVCRISLVVERYRIAQGELPDSLSALVPQFVDVVPIDPFNGQPLRYKKLAKGYVVYSGGEDGKDDGGDEKKDITFTVER